MYQTKSKIIFLTITFGFKIYFKEPYDKLCHTLISNKLLTFNLDFRITFFDKLFNVDILNTANEPNAYKNHINTMHY